MLDGGEVEVGAPTHRRRQRIAAPDLRTWFGVSEVRLDGALVGIRRIYYWRIESGNAPQTASLPARMGVTSWDYRRSFVSA